MRFELSRLRFFFFELKSWFYFLHIPLKTLSTKVLIMHKVVKKTPKKTIYNIILIHVLEKYLNNTQTFFLSQKLLSYRKHNSFLAKVVLRMPK